MITRLKTIFAPPGPKELGWSKGGALPLWSITPFVDEKTWEDWREHVKAEYPVRYFLSEVVGRWVSFQVSCVGRAWYWLKCHVLTSYQYHKLDLRGVDPVEPKYTHGYLSPNEVLWLAAWAALCLYIKEEPKDPALWMTEEDFKDPETLRQKQNYDEAQALYRWWTVDRLEDNWERLYQDMQTCVKTGDKERYVQARTLWLASMNHQEEKEDEMFERLMKIRRSLWT